VTSSVQLFIKHSTLIDSGFISVIIVKADSKNRKCECRGRKGRPNSVHNTDPENTMKLHLNGNKSKSAM